MSVTIKGQHRVQQHHRARAATKPHPKQSAAHLAAQPPASKGWAPGGGSAVRASGQHLFDSKGNNVGGTSTPHGSKSLTSGDQFQQVGQTLKSRSGGTIGNANIPIGNGYSLNVADVQNGRYRAEGQTVKDSRGNALPINLSEFKELTRTIKRNKPGSI